MEEIEIGMKFHSYEDLSTVLDNWCAKNKCKYWKRDARTITGCRASGVCKYINPDLVYYEIKFSCVYGGMGVKQKQKSRNRQQSLKSSGCTSYIRLRASEDGATLIIVSMNLIHNHELKLPGIRNENQKATSNKHKRQIQARDDHSEFQQNDIIEDEMQSVVNSNSEDAESCKKPFTYTGLIAPVFTPFNDDLSLNLDIIPTYAQYLLDVGIEGVLVNGTTGEGTLMTITERKLVTEAWAQICAETQQHLMVQVGGAALPDVLELAQHAESHGADSLLCLPELYHKPTTTDELIQYLQTVGSAAPNVPLLYYHIPSLTNVNIHMGKFLSEIGDQISTFSGIKFTSTVLDEGVAAVKVCNGKYKTFLGADTIMAGAYALGFNSAIATTLNIFPQHGRAILEQMRNGQVVEAMEVQDTLNSAIELITKHGTWVPTMKAAMNLLVAINVGPVRAPLKRLSPEQVNQIEKDLKDLKIIE